MLANFMAMFGLAAILLVLAYIIPPLRRNPGVTYPIVMVAGSYLMVLSYGPMTYLDLICAIIFVGVMWWQMRRAQKKYALAASDVPLTDSV